MADDAEGLQFGRWAKGQAIPWNEWCAFVAERRAAHPDMVIPRNAGNRRTESKKALLKAIEDLGGKW